MELIRETSDVGLYSVIASKLAWEIETVLARNASESNASERSASESNASERSALDNERNQRLCILGIVGGRSIAQIMDMLLPYAPRLAGKGRIHVFWLDERVDSDKNYAPVLQYLEHMHRAGVDILWHPLQGMNKQAITIESRQVMNEFTTLRNPPRFDITLLSAGEDGHIASLFPHHAHLRTKSLGYLIVENAPKKPADRITVTPVLISESNSCFLLFVGEKKTAFERFSDSNISTDECPAKLTLSTPHLTVGVLLR